MNLSEQAQKKEDTSPYGSFDPNEEDHLNNIADHRAPMPSLAFHCQDERQITSLCCSYFSKHFGYSEPRDADDRINLLRENPSVTFVRLHNTGIKAGLYLNIPENLNNLNCLTQTPVLPFPCTTTCSDIYCTSEAKT